MFAADQTETVSIIIPIYQVHDYIEDCIDSVIRQTYPHLEIILVDDCGQDDSCRLATQRLRHSSRVWRCIHHSTNRGLSAARNTGVNEATGKYIYFLDSDDYIAEHTIETLVSAIKKHQSDVVIGSGIVLLHEDGTLHPIWKDTENDLHLTTPLRAYLQRKHNFAAWHRLINTAAYRSSGVKFIEGIIHEDVPWSLHMAMSGLSLCSSEGKNLYYYRQRTGSIMSQQKHSAKRVHGFITALREHYKVMLANNLHKDPDFCSMYASLYRETINMIMENRAMSFRKRCLAISDLIGEFNFCIPEIENLHRLMYRFTTWSRILPAAIAFKLAVFCQKAS